MRSASVFVGLGLVGLLTLSACAASPGSAAPSSTPDVTQDPIPLALYDPLADPDPTAGREGATDEDRLLEIQDLLPDLLGDDASVYLRSVPDRHVLWVDVVWDDGTLQQAADADFGTDVIVIRSALREIED